MQTCQRRKALFQFLATQLSVNLHVALVILIQYSFTSFFKPCLRHRSWDGNVRLSVGLSISVPLWSSLKYLDNYANVCTTMLDNMVVHTFACKILNKLNCTWTFKIHTQPVLFSNQGMLKLWSSAPKAHRITKMLLCMKSSRLIALL